MPNVWIITQKQQLISVAITKADEIYNLLSKGWTKDLCALGDCEMRLKNKTKEKDKESTGVYILYDWNEDDANDSDINAIAARMVLDGELLEPPYIPEKNTEKLIKRYFQVFPRRQVVLYKMQGNEIAAYTQKELQQDWNSFFTENPPYLNLATSRYVDFSQPLLECAKSQSGKFEFHSVARALLEIYLGETPKNSATQRDRFHRLFLGASLALLFGIQDWKKLCRWPQKILLRT
jgi:hypothetical protein